MEGVNGWVTRVRKRLLAGVELASGRGKWVSEEGEEGEEGEEEIRKD